MTVVVTQADPPWAGRGPCHQALCCMNSRRKMGGIVDPSTTGSAKREEPGVGQQSEGWVSKVGGDGGHRHALVIEETEPQHQPGGRCYPPYKTVESYFHPTGQAGNSKHQQLCLSYFVFFPPRRPFSQRCNVHTYGEVVQGHWRSISSSTLNHPVCLVQLGCLHHVHSDRPF